MKSKELMVNDNVCTYIKLDESIEFICERCKKRKISKKYARYIEGGVEKNLCNACYGRLLSLQNEA